MTDSDWKWLNRVVNEFRKRLPKQIDRGELISDGYLALARLRDRFDPALGVPFHGFAYRRVIGALQDGLRQRYRPRELRAAENDVAVEPSPIGRTDLPLHRLPRMGRLVIQLHYFEQMELQWVAATFGCTAARISQIHQGALRALRESVD